MFCPETLQLNPIKGLTLINEPNPLPPDTMLGLMLFACHPDAFVQLVSKFQVVTTPESNIVKGGRGII